MGWSGAAKGSRSNEFLKIDSTLRSRHAPVSNARSAAAFIRVAEYCLASRITPRQARYPASGCGLSAMMRSSSLAVCGPVVSPQCRMRDGVHSRCCADGPHES